MLPYLSLFPVLALTWVIQTQLLEETGDIFYGFLCGEGIFIESKIGHSYIIWLSCIFNNNSKESILAIIIMYRNVINNEAWPSYSCTRSPKSYK